jgi:hypothetical protein
MAVPVVFALLLAVSFGLFGVGATTAASDSCAFGCENSATYGIGFGGGSQFQPSQMLSVSAKLNPGWQSASGNDKQGPDHICDVCEAHHGGVYHPNYCYECIKKGDTPVLPDY